MWWKKTMRKQFNLPVGIHRAGIGICKTDFPNLARQPWVIGEADIPHPLGNDLWIYQVVVFAIDYCVYDKASMGRKIRCRAIH